MTHRRRGRVRSVYWGLLAVVLTVLGATCLVLWSAQSTRTPVQAIDVPPALAPIASAQPGPSAPPSEAPTRPVGLRIPSLGLATRLIGLGLQEDGTVEVPLDPSRAGWFRLGPPPGALGSAVILGHVDSPSGPAVFYRLRELRPGDRIAVGRDDGSTVRFEVRSVDTYLNADFPAQKVYGSHGRSELNLVTCGGAYDADRGGYQANVVVNAHLV